MFVNVDDVRQGSNRIALARIDAVVSARLGPARVRGNAQPAAFHRQIAMYLAHRVGGWSTTRIGRFYNGRDHSTVCHAIKRIQALRDANAEVEGLLSSLIQELTTDQGAELNPPSTTAKADLCRARDRTWTNEMLDDLAERIASRLRSRNCG
jgi:Bacterial dnaA protein helix-turn-helix